MARPNTHLPADTEQYDASGLVVLQRTYRWLDWREFACGWGAAFINITVTYPVYKLIIRQMLHGVKARSAFDQLRKEGLFFLYRGVFPPLAQKTVSLSLMFGVYDGTRRQLVDGCHVGAYFAKSIAGLTAGTVEATLMPFERLQTLLADSTYHKHFRNTFDSCRVVWQQYGFREFYRGLTPILLRNGPSNVLFFIMREEAAERLPKQKTKTYQAVQDFTAGALIGAFLSSLFYPINVVKFVMQSQLGGPYQNMFTVLAQIYRERDRKVINIYKGFEMNAWRAFVSWGIMNTAYEHIKALIY